MLTSLSCFFLLYVCQLEIGKQKETLDFQESLNVALRLQ
nr:MAG TPA: hypothetical protein [Caudoviricetes sp.]